MVCPFRGELIQDCAQSAQASSNRLGAFKLGKNCQIARAAVFKAVSLCTIANKDFGRACARIQRINYVSKCKRFHVAPLVHSASAVCLYICLDRASYAL